MVKCSALLRCQWALRSNHDSLKVCVAKRLIATCTMYVELETATVNKLCFYFFYHRVTCMLVWILCCIINFYAVAHTGTRTKNSTLTSSHFGSADFSSTGTGIELQGTAQMVMEYVLWSQCALPPWPKYHKLKLNFPLVWGTHSLRLMS